MFMSPISAATPLDLDEFLAHPLRSLHTLPGVSIHLFSLARCAARQDELAAALSAAEIRRARSISNTTRRMSFIASRALLRQALSDFCGTTAPTAWEFQSEVCGKPRIVGPEGEQLYFNLSYTGATLALVVSKKYELGIDIESLDPEASQEVPWQVLTSAERQFIRSMPEDERFLEFLRLWTLKEAYAKYIGLGATLDFREVEVSLDRVYASAPSAAATPFVAPMLVQQMLDIDGVTNVLALGAGRIRAACEPGRHF